LNYPVTFLIRSEADSCEFAQGRTQDRADGAKAPPPEIPRKKIIYSFKSGVFYVLQFVHPVADYVPPIQLIN